MEYACHHRHSLKSHYNPLDANLIDFCRLVGDTECLKRRILLAPENFGLEVQLAPEKCFSARWDTIGQIFNISTNCHLLQAQHA